MNPLSPFSYSTSTLPELIPPPPQKEETATSGPMIPRDAVFIRTEIDKKKKVGKDTSEKEESATLHTSFFETPSRKKSRKKHHTCLSNDILNNDKDDNPSPFCYTNTASAFAANNEPTEFVMLPTSTNRMPLLEQEETQALVAFEQWQRQQQQQEQQEQQEKGQEQQEEDVYRQQYLHTPSQRNSQHLQGEKRKRGRPCLSEEEKMRRQAAKCMLKTAKRKTNSKILQDNLTLFLEEAASSANPTPIPNSPLRGRAIPSSLSMSSMSPKPSFAEPFSSIAEPSAEFFSSITSTRPTTSTTTPLPCFLPGLAVNSDTGLLNRPEGRKERGEDIVMRDVSPKKDFLETRMNVDVDDDDDGSNSNGNHDCDYDCDVGNFNLDDDEEDGKPYKKKKSKLSVSKKHAIQPTPNHHPAYKNKASIPKTKKKKDSDGNDKHDKTISNHDNPLCSSGYDDEKKCEGGNDEETEIKMNHSSVDILCPPECIQATRIQRYIRITCLYELAKHGINLYIPSSTDNAAERRETLKRAIRVLSEIVDREIPIVNVDGSVPSSRPTIGQVLCERRQQHASKKKLERRHPE